MTEPESDKDTTNDVDMRILDKVPAVKEKQPKSAPLVPVAVNKCKLHIIGSRDMLILTCMKRRWKKRKSNCGTNSLCGKA